MFFHLFRYSYVPIRFSSCVHMKPFTFRIQFILNILYFITFMGIIFFCFYLLSAGDWHKESEANDFLYLTSNKPPQHTCINSDSL